MGFYEFVLKAFETLDVWTIIGIVGVGLFFYDRAMTRIDKSENNLKELVNSLKEQVNQSENNLRELVNQSENKLRDLLTATIKPIQEQVYNHIPTQISKLEKKVDDMVKENNQNYKDILNLLNQHLSNELTKQKPPE